MIVPFWLAYILVRRICPQIFFRNQAKPSSCIMGSCICPAKNEQNNSRSEQPSSSAVTTTTRASVSIVVPHSRSTNQTLDVSRLANCNHCRDGQNHSSGRNHTRDSSSGRHSSQNHHRHMLRSGQAMIDSLVLSFCKPVPFSTVHEVTSVKTKKNRAIGLKK